MAYWTPERIASAVPRDYTIEDGGLRKLLRTDQRKLQSTVADGDWTNGGTINEAAGRLLFSRNGGNYVCSASVIDDYGTPGRSLVATAAHCIYDEDNDIFATNMIFIPKQDDVSHSTNRRSLLNGRYL